MQNSSQLRHQLSPVQQLSPVSGTANSSPSEGEIAQKIQHLSEILVLQNEHVSKLLHNFDNNVPEEVPSQDNLLHKYRLLLQVCSSIVCVRDRKTLSMIGCNKAYAEYFRSHNTAIPQDEAELVRLYNDPLIVLVLWTITREKESSLDLLRTRFLMHGSNNSLFLMDVTYHFESDIFWLEAKEVKPAIFDDEFTLGTHHHRSTVRIELPLNDPEKAWQMYEQPNKARFRKMMNYLLSKHSTL